jgi:hypothetical protein
LTRRANQGHINIIAKIHKACAENPPRAFCLKFFDRTCCSIGPAQNILKLSTQDNEFVQPVPPPGGLLALLLAAQR